MSVLNQPTPEPSPATAGGLAGFVELATESRSGQIESVHSGCIAVIDTTGKLIASAGDAELPIFWRSTAKLHQALPLVMAGGVSRLDLTDEQFAVICSSHYGEPRQVECVSSILKQVGSNPSVLICGSQEPWSRAAALELIRTGRSPTALHHMCSGNHAGFIGLAKLLGADQRTYDRLENPAQQTALQTVARFTGLHETEIGLGRDGCGIPSYRTPVRRLAQAFARLLSVPPEWPDDIRHAAAVLSRSVVRHPEMLSAAGEWDVEVVRAFDGAALCKLGAEGVCAAAFAPAPETPHCLPVSNNWSSALWNSATASRAPFRKGSRSAGVKRSAKSKRCFGCKGPRAPLHRTAEATRAYVRGRRRGQKKRRWLRALPGAERSEQQGGDLPLTNSPRVPVAIRRA